jgi:hypothetical protein
MQHPSRGTQPNGSVLTFKFAGAKLIQLPGSAWAKLANWKA